MVRTLALVACLVAFSILRGFAQSPAVQAPPVFRSSVDLMRIDVTVLDKKTRKPITGLKAEDFEVKVGGKPQPIQAVAETVTRSPAASGATWQTTAGRDVVSNGTSATRLVVIVMDDSLGGLWHRQAGKKVAHKIIDELGPDDLAAVVFANKTEFSQDLTADRSLLRAAVESFDPLANRRFGFPDTGGTVRNVRMFLGKLASYRRAIMVVTRLGPPPGPHGKPVWAWVENAGLADQDSEATDSPDFEAASRLSHVPIYFFSTFGLTVSTNPAARGPGQELAALARRTGGRAVIENNAPETEVAPIFDELRSIYTLAYAPTFQFDGKYRFADIKVNRPDVIVLPATGAFRTAREADDADSRRKVNVTKGFGLLAAVAAPLMEGELPLSLSTAAIAVHGIREQAVAVTLGLPAPDAAAGPQQYNLQMMVYDGEGRQQLSSTRSVVTIAPAGGRPDSPAEVLLRLDLRPGRYNLRVGAESVGGDSAGSVFTSVVVPDFTKERLSMSGPAIGWAEGRPIGGRETVQSLLPFAPTVGRGFAASDRVGALVRVHQGGGRPEPLKVDTHILDASNAVVASRSDAFEASAFPAGTGVEHRYELPLKTLAPGEYLLRFTATAAGRTVSRDVRFSIR